MNTPNPLVPQGTTPAWGKSTVRNLVSIIVFVHVAFIGGLLFWGCGGKDAPKKDGENVSSMTTDGATTAADTNLGTASVPGGSVAVPGATSVVPPAAAISTTSAPALAPAAAVLPQVTTMTPPVAPTASASASEYTIVKGDVPATIAKNHGVSVKALMDANPGLDPKKLVVGKKIQIPAAAATAVASTAATTPGALTGEAPTGAGEVYTVKQGDSLTHIATSHHTTVKAIVALNGLKSQNNIKPGQKLKMPAPKAASTTTASAPGSSASAAGSAVTPLTPVTRAN